MTAADGEVLGATKILDNGPDEDRFVIALLAEGFRADSDSDPAPLERSISINTIIAPSSSRGPAWSTPR